MPRKRTDWVHRIFFFNDKVHYISLQFRHLRFFPGSTWSRSKPISHKTVEHILNIKNIEFKVKKNARIFETLFYFSFIFLNIPHTNCENNPASPIINVVRKYLRQFFGTSFGAVTLRRYCNID